ncbi:hypothetical protein HK102_008787 [Quaeritorhiza haematococci]|nr:hypothetical protein HK102_008787 [Quaeritorhiza haematococci]
MAKYSGFLTTFVRERILNKLDYVAYGTRDLLEIGQIDTMWLDGSLSTEEAAVRDNILSLVSQFQKTLSVIRAVDVARHATNVPSRSISYTVEVPVCKLLLSSSLLPENPNHSAITIGELLPCRLEIKHEGKWMTESVQQFNVECEVQVDVRFWMLAGKRRRTLTIAPNNPSSLSVALVPLQTGLLPLPTVTINVLENSAQTSNFVRTHCSTISRQIRVLPRARSGHIFLDDVAVPTAEMQTSPGQSLQVGIGVPQWFGRKSSLPPKSPPSRRMPGLV